MIFEQQIKLWRPGGVEFECVFTYYLVEGLVFSRENLAEWNIVPCSIDVREINRILSREEETI